MEVAWGQGGAGGRERPLERDCFLPQTRGRALCLEPDGGSEWVLQLPWELERALLVPTDYSASFGQLEQGGGGTDVSAGGVDFP